MHVRGVALAALFAFCRASAANPLSPELSALRAASPVVTIEVKAEPEIVSRLRPTAVALLERLGVTAVVVAESSRSEEAARPLARAYIDLENPRLPRLVVVDGQTRQELARRTLPRTTSPETSIEAVTLVLYMIIESLLPHGSETEAAEAEPTDAPEHERPPVTDTSNEPPRMEPTPAAPRQSPSSRDNVANEPTPVDSRPRAVSLAAGAFLRTLLLDGSRPVVGAALAAELHDRSELGLALLAAAHAPTQFSFEAAEFDLALYSLRLSPRIPVWTRPRIVTAVELGVGVDWFRTRLERAAPDSVGPSSTSSLSYVVSAAVAVRIRLTSALLLSASTGIDLDVSPRRFVVQAGEQRSPVLEPTRLRPWALLGLALSPNGSSQLTASAKGAP